MVWKERSRMNERMLLIGEYLKGQRPMTELCLEFGVSRKTAYKWVARYKEDGPAGLADRSRAATRHPHGATDRVAGVIAGELEEHVAAGSDEYPEVPRAATLLLLQKHAGGVDA